MKLSADLVADIFSVLPRATAVLSGSHEITLKVGSRVTIEYAWGMGAALAMYVDHCKIGLTPEDRGAFVKWMKESKASLVAGVVSDVDEEFGALTRQTSKEYLLKIEDYV